MKENQAILYACHDDDDGMWQFLCGKSYHETEDAMLVALDEIYKYDKSVAAIADLPYGYGAEREDDKSKWIVFQNT